MARESTTTTEGECTVPRKDVDPQVASLLPPVELSRRSVIAGALAGGFALAVQPVAATTITTDARGLVAGAARIPVPDGSIPAYRAKPEGAGPFPVVIVASEIFGVHEYIQDTCRRLAHRGYLAVAPDFFVRQGDVASAPSMQEVMPIVMRAPDSQVMSDLDATVAWAGAAEEAGDLDRLGITGFCWGGRTTWLYAAHAARLRAGVAWYGGLAGHRTEQRPRQPIDLAGELKAPVLGLYAGEDQGIPLSDVERMQAALAQAPVKAQIHVYPGVPHGFHADYRASFRPDAAQDGWRRMLEWFAAHGVA
jgi:carboxymethylenebutenolidase